MTTLTNAQRVTGPSKRPPWIRRRWSTVLTLVLLGVVLLGYVIGPMIATARRSISQDKAAVLGFSFKAWSDFFANPTQTSAIGGSIVLSLLSVLVAGLLGTAVAILLTRWDFPGRRICQVLALLPIALPPLMGVWSFKLLFGVGGRIPFAMQEWFGFDQQTFWLQGLAGVLIVHAMTMYPYFFLTVSAALANADSSLEEAAESMGASTGRVWRKVVLPMLTPALVAGSLITFMSAMSSYTAPLLFQYTDVMTQQIVIAKTNGDMRLASIISTTLAIISIVFLAIIRSYEQRKVYRTQSKGGGRKRSTVTSTPLKVLLVIIAVPTTLFLVLPIVMIAVLSFTAKGGWLRSVLPTGYTLEWWAQLFEGADFWRPVTNSLLMSLIAVGGAMILGAGAAYVMSRMHFRGKLVLDIAIMLPWALPGTVVAINLITAFSSPSPFAFGQVLVGTFAILPLAYFVRFNPLIFRSTFASFSQLDPNLEDAARSLGASWWYAFRKVVLPLVSRGIMAGALLAFVDGVGEFVASILIYTPAWVPLSIAINNENYQGNIGTGSVYGMIQVLLVLGVLIITRRMEAKQGTAVTL
ncbi:iron(III) transport system permease protein [Microbacterium sp. W4I4]|uniref:ABC transporter permease n=1 Tax=Microbacterium sp. W4I4 TaxID=3042295 RepID=UPI0027856372|nr:iron ABC transporter permease [Microbacterium sp. W4I4]MDQ0614754.1 iron(III) transport system permease protein [Microbacterium sp. W4I4]